MTREIPSSSPTISTIDDDEEEDLVIALIKRTGCLDQHNAIMECMYNYKDWRKCQNEVKLFRQCMSKKEENAFKMPFLKNNLS
ncbi:unnamed protein product [Hymenolepis diminuta]|uniref:CHCH domain-containing protein n=1 Tax=Hymenolepis diminuta TaxID=6216 RepID=A0A3P6W093_HYMDI|nr:unnamed protein product [Hymenolepis diminuta]